METLSQKQRRFAKWVPRLIDKAYEMGYEVTLGDAYRDPRLFGWVGESKGYGHRNSCHKLRLAIDLNLFLDGNYLTDTQSHRFLGEWWESQGDDHKWGGRFPVPDGNHYSIQHEGKS